MTKTILLFTVTAIFAILLTACVTELGTSRQRVCTQEDIDNGTCGDPGGGSPPAEDPPLAAPPTSVSTWDVYNEAVARNNGPVSCGWDRCDLGGGYVCTGPNAKCIFTRTGYFLCSWGDCFNSDLVCGVYQCNAWRNRSRF